MTQTDFLFDVLLCNSLFSTSITQKQCCQAALKEIHCTNGMTGAKRNEMCDYFQKDLYYLNTTMVCVQFFYIE